MNKRQKVFERNYEDRYQSQKEVEYYLGEGMFLQDRVSEIDTEEDMIDLINTSIKRSSTCYDAKFLLDKMLPNAQVMNLSLEELKKQILIEMSVRTSQSLEYKEENINDFKDEDKINLKKITKIRKNNGLNTKLSLVDVFMINDMQNHNIKITDEMILKYKKLYKFNIISSDLSNVSEFESGVPITNKNIKIARNFKENDISMTNKNFITIQVIKVLLKERYNVNQPFKIKSNDLDEILTKLIQFKEEKSFMKNVKGMFNSKEEKEEKGMKIVKSIVGNELIME